MARPYSSTGSNKLKPNVYEYQGHDEDLYRLEEEDQSAILIKEGLKSARNSNPQRLMSATASQFNQVISNRGKYN